jgi:hypothetical protein
MKHDDLQQARPLFLIPTVSCIAIQLNKQLSGWLERDPDHQQELRILLSRMTNAVAQEVPTTWTRSHATFLFPDVKQQLQWHRVWLLRVRQSISGYKARQFVQYNDDTIRRDRACLHWRQNVDGNQLNYLCSLLSYKLNHYRMLTGNRSFIFCWYSPVFIAFLRHNSSYETRPTDSKTFRLPA